MMRTAELRPPPVRRRAKGQVRDGLRYVRSVPDLWVPLVMMAVIGTFAFNFQVVFPLFVTRDLGGDDTDVHACCSRSSASARWSGRWPRPAARSIRRPHVVA